MDFEDYKDIKIKGICEENLNNRIDSLSEEEGNFQILFKDENNFLQWINSCDGDYNLERHINATDNWDCVTVSSKGKLKEIVLNYLNGDELNEIEWSKFEDLEENGTYNLDKSKKVD